jgi:hypothetical protein
MENRNKKIFLIASITIPFLLYSGYYYGVMIKNAPYKFSDFDHISIQYGDRDSMLNKYNSKTGDYQYLTKKDSLVKMHLYLHRTYDLQYLHRKAADLGFWDFPSQELGDTSVKAPRYIIEFAYKRKTKRVIFDANFNGNPKLKDANERLIKEILARINDAQG